MSKNITTYDNVWKELTQKGITKRKVYAVTRLHQNMLDKIVRLIRLIRKSRDNVKVLELGCGRGIDSYYLAKNENVEVYGVDISTISIQVAKDIGKFLCANEQISLLVGDAKKLQFKDKIFDVIFSQGLMEHFKDPSNFMKEQIRVLKDDGFLIVDVPQKYSLYTLQKRQNMDKGIWKWGWETEYSYGELKKLGKKFGLEVIDCYGWGYDDYLLRIRVLYKSILRSKSTHAFDRAQRLYENFMQYLEKKCGQYFMMCIGVVYKKRNAWRA